ncbi:ribonuclease H-like domain-containing protein [Tanacetum coccineum]
MIPFCTTDPLISQGPKDSEEDVGMKPTEVNESGASDKGEEDEQDIRSEFERLLQKEKQTNSTNSFNTVGTPVSAAGPSIIMMYHHYQLMLLKLLMHLRIIYLNDFLLLKIHLLFYMFQMCFQLMIMEFLKVWILVDLHNGKRAIGTKWVFRNKKDDRGIIVRNKARLVAQGYTQEEGIDYDEGFAPVARIEAIRLFLAYASYMGFIVHKMDVKCTFLYGTIEEELASWYETLIYLTFLENRFRRGTIDKTLFIKKDKNDTQEIPNEFYGGAHLLLRSMIGSLMYLTASRPDITFAMCACARFQVTPKVLHLHAVKRIFRYLKGQPKLGLWYPRDSSFDLEAFYDTDYAGAILEGNPNKEVGQFLGKKLLWIQNQMLDYGFSFMNTKIHIDNESTICIVKNPVFHSRTKHIKIRHNLIQDSYEKKLIQVIKIHRDHNVADLHTKAFDVSRIEFIDWRLQWNQLCFVVMRYTKECKFPKNDEGLGAQEDASKQRRSIEDIDKDAEVSLVDETQGRSDDTEMFDTYALIGDEVLRENDMNEKQLMIFETYVKSKDLDLWHIIINGDFQTIIQNLKTKLDEVVPFENQTDDLKRMLSKNNEAKMVIYNALPKKEYERIFMCNTEKEIWKTLLITHQSNNQVKDNKIDLLVQQYEQFVIFEGESIDSTFARFNTIITSLKALDEGSEDEEYSMAIFLRVDLEPDEWIKDSRCSKHMTGNRKLFSTYKAYNGGNVIFGSNLRSNIIGKGTISNDSLKIDNVEHVDNLGFNLISIGHICDNKCRVTFSEHDSEITKDGKVIGRGIRKKGLYVMKLGNKPKDKICLATIDENSTLWHRRLGHTNMRLIQSLASKELVRNLPKLKFDQHFCDACKIGKQAHVSHKAKNIVSTTRCLELLHMDLFGPSAVRSYGGNRYTLVIVDDYSRYTWTRFLKDKTEAFDQFHPTTLNHGVKNFIYAVHNINSLIPEKRGISLNQTTPQEMLSFPSLTPLYLSVLPRNSKILQLNGHHSMGLLPMHVGSTIWWLNVITTIAAFLQLLEAQQNHVGPILVSMLNQANLAHSSYQASSLVKQPTQQPSAHNNRLFSPRFQCDIKSLQCDHEGEFDNNALHQLFATNGITIRFSCPKTSQQNGKSERMIRTINNLIRTLLFQAHLPPTFWVEALHMAAHLLNILPSTAINNEIPHTRLYKTTPNYADLRVFGCLCYPHVHTNHKLEPRATPSIFLGYPTNHRGYRCLDLNTDKIILSRHVTFDETVFPYGSMTPDASPPYNFLDTDPNLIQKHMLHNMPTVGSSPVAATRQPTSPSPQPTSTSAHSTGPPTNQPTNHSTLQPTPSAPTNPTPTTNLPPTNSIPPTPPPVPSPATTQPNRNPASTHSMVTRYRVGTNRPTQRYTLSVSTISPIPKSYNHAFQDPHWYRAMLDEYNALIKNNTWILVPRPSDANIVRSLWLFRHKYNADGTLNRYKARLVANGSTQLTGIDVDETFSPVVKPATIRTVLSLALSRHWPVHQLDVKNAFLHGSLSETVYMQQPPGFRDSQHPDHVCLLQRSLYGLKQAPRAWFQRFAAYAARVGFIHSRCDTSLFIYRRGSDTAYLLLYVDDIILTASSTAFLQSIIATLHAEFSMTDLGPLNYFLGISVTRNTSGMFLSQQKYASELLERAGMLTCNPCRTPVDTDSKLSADGDPVSDPTLYRSLAGALQYLTFTRPDISYAVQQVCLYMHDPREPHFSALKRILRYIRGTMPYGLQLFSSTTSSLVAYSDADWAGCPTTRRSTSGYCVFLGNNLLSWSSKRQVTLSRSSAEAEYRGVANAVAETCWLRNLLRELHTPLSTATLVYCDNVSAVYLSSNPVQHQRTKHIEIDIHFVRDLVAAGHIRVLHVPSRYQYADVFTKGLPTVLFDEFRSSLSVRSSPAQTAGGC